MLDKVTTVSASMLDNVTIVSASMLYMVTIVSASMLDKVNILLPPNLKILKRLIHYQHESLTRYNNINVNP
jgi:hypothetical protein